MSMKNYQIPGSSYELGAKMNFILAAMEPISNVYFHIMRTSYFWHKYLTDINQRISGNFSEIRLSLLRLLLKNWNFLKNWFLKQFNVLHINHSTTTFPDNILSLALIPLSVRGVLNFRKIIKKSDHIYWSKGTAKKPSI